MNGKTIAVNGKNFRWTAVYDRSGYTVIVQSLFVNGQKLRIEGLPLLSQNMRCGDIEGDVAFEYNITEMICAALRRGWDPYAEELPDFVM